MGGEAVRLDPGVSRAAVDWHAGIEPNWRIPTPPLWLAVALAAALIATAIVRGRWKGAGAAVVMALLAVMCWHPFAPDIARNQLELTAIDVGQGDSLLVSFPDGKLMVVDGGGIPTFGRRTKSNMEIGEDVVSPYLWGRSIRRIDVLALTHAHEDHIGGLSAIMANFHVRELWTGAMSDNPLWDALRDQARRSGVRIVPMQSGSAFAFGGAQVEVLAPPADYTAPDVPKNNDSLVMRLAFGRNTFLLTGDMERQVEAELFADGRLDAHGCAQGAASRQQNIQHGGFSGRAAAGVRDHFGWVREFLRASASGCAGAPGRARSRGAAHRSGRAGLNSQRRAAVVCRYRPAKCCGAYGFIRGLLKRRRLLPRLRLLRLRPDRLRAHPR